MPNTLEEVTANLEGFEELSPYDLEPFWAMPDFGDDPYWGVGDPKNPLIAPTLFVSGPSRNGNHLVHSLLDDHPDLPRLPGEDSLLAALFNDLLHDRESAVERLRGDNAVEYLLDLSGYGCNKWKLLSEMGSGGERETEVWAGVHEEGTHFVADYQDTVVQLDYEAFATSLQERADEIRTAPTFVDVMWIYLDALSRLDPRRDPSRRFPYLLVGSGMRAESAFVFARTRAVKCVTPIRPFENYYFSFAKGRLGSTEIRQELIQEAWEHWWHKVVDYLLLKQTDPDLVCLVNFKGVLDEPARAGREICRFLGVDYSESWLTPTSMGIPVKGNSSFPKDEDARGRIYRASGARRLPEEHWPEMYPQLWSMVEALSV